MKQQAEPEVRPLPAEYYEFCKNLQHWKTIHHAVTNNPEVNPFPYNSFKHVTWLLGYNWNDFRDQYTDEDRETLKKLYGPHGYTLYQVLLTRRRAQEENK